MFCCCFVEMDPNLSFDLIESSAQAIMAEAGNPREVVDVESDDEEELLDDEFMFLEDLTDESIPNLPPTSADVSNFNALLPVSMLETFVEHPEVSEVMDTGSNSRALVPVSTKGLRDECDPSLAEAARGEEKQPSEHNDKWAMRRADSLRTVLGWDMHIALGDLPLEKLDELFSILFARAVKIDGTPYPSATLMGMMNGLNRIIRHASVLRSLKGITEGLVEKGFNINSHANFARTRLVLKAAIRKSATEGVNKKRKQVRVLTELMESEVLADMDHSLNDPHGCQKRLAFYCLVRLGIRGGQELWNLKRQDLSIEVDKDGKQFIRFEERESKNNNYTLERYSEEQFRNVFHSYEADFVLTVKQYYRHLPPLTGETKPDLFLGPITNPATMVWYNKTHKVAKDRASGWIKTMLKLVGFPDDLFSNKSGRATLITRMAARGVLDHVGMLISGHRTTGEYERYDRTKALKMEAATLVGSRPDLSYEMALQEVSKKFVKDDIVGTASSVKPLTVDGPNVGALVAHVSGNANLPPVICTDITGSSSANSSESRGMLKRKSESGGSPKNEKWYEDNKDRVESWHKQMEAAIDWDAYLAKNPDIAKRSTGGSMYKIVSGGTNTKGSGNQIWQNCTIIYNCGEKKDDNKENIGPSS